MKLSFQTRKVLSSEQQTHISERFNLTFDKDPDEWQMCAEEKGHVGVMKCSLWKKTGIFLNALNLNEEDKKGQAAVFPAEDIPTEYRTV